MWCVSRPMNLHSRQLYCLPIFDLYTPGYHIYIETHLWSMLKFNFTFISHYFWKLVFGAPHFAAVDSLRKHKDELQGHQFYLAKWPCFLSCCFFTHLAREFKPTQRQVLMWQPQKTRMSLMRKSSMRIFILILLAKEFVFERTNFGG